MLVKLLFLLLAAYQWRFGWGRIACRAIPAALHTPNWGGTRCHRELTTQSVHHLAPQRKLRSPKSKDAALEINEVGRPLKESAYALHLLWAPLKARYSIYT